MTMKKTNGTYTVGERTVPYTVCIPDGNPKGIVQIVHGMCECFERYENTGLVEFLCAGGYIVCGCDLEGHGDRVTDGNYGDFSSYCDLEADIAALQTELRKKYRFLPYFYLSHSFGSFLMRDLLLDGFSEASGVILSGTCGDSDPVSLGIAASYLFGLFRRKKPSPILRALIFKRYAGMIGQSDPTAWICSDRTLLEPCIGDPKADFSFSARAYRETFRLMKALRDEERLETLPHSVPILLLSGKRDPVGGCGDGVQFLYDTLFEAGVDDLTLKLYDGARHEVLNDLSREQVRADLLSWLDEECTHRVMLNTWR